MTDPKRSGYTPNWAVGIALGVALGASFSVALDDVALALGAGLAAAFAMALGSSGDEPEDDGDGLDDVAPDDDADGSDNKDVQQRRRRCGRRVR